MSLESATLLPPVKKVYTTIEVNVAKETARLHNASIRYDVKAGDQAQLCACNCGGVLPVGTVMQGWKYLKGHKQTFNSKGDFKNGSGESEARSYNTQTKVYEQMLDRIKLDIANAESDSASADKELAAAQKKKEAARTKLSQLLDAAKGMAILAGQQYVYKVGENVGKQLDI